MKFIKKLLFIILFFLLFVNLVSAHSQKFDQSFGLILHVEPNDEPVAKQKSDLRLLFTQTPANFDPAQGSCIVEIYQGEKLLYRQDVFRETQKIDDIHFNFVFPEIGIYKVKVAGVPDQTGIFQSFNFEYDLRVEKSAKNSIFSRYSQSSLLIIFFAGLFIVSAIIIFWYVKKNSN